MLRPQQQQLIYEIIRLVQIYNARGFQVRSIFTDGHFVGSREPLLPLNLNVTAANKHVPEIELSIQTSFRFKEISSLHVQTTTMITVPLVSLVTPV